MKKQLIWSIIKEFIGKNKLGFTTQDVDKGIPERNRLYLTRLLAEMVHQGMLLKDSTINDLHAYRPAFILFFMTNTLTR